jgi:hypothetical protein
MPSHDALIQLHRERMQSLLRRTTTAIRQMRDEDINWRPNPESNTIASLLVHMAGNLQQRMESNILGLPDKRDRDAEFNFSGHLSQEQAVSLIEGAYGMTDRVLSELTPEQLGQVVRVRGDEQSVLEVIFGVVAHQAEHVGQILYIAKLRLGAEYRVQSMPHKRI